jgi:hypothetical protein
VNLAERTVQACLVVVGLIHLVPVTGVAGAARLADLYGLSIEGVDLLILMRHRAVLFGILGVLMVAAAFRKPLRATALAAGFASVGSFLALALAAGGYNAAIARVVGADVVALGLLVVALVLHVRRG